MSSFVPCNILIMGLGFTNYISCSHSSRDVFEVIWQCKHILGIHNQSGLFCIPSSIRYHIGATIGQWSQGPEVIFLCPYSPADDLEEIT